MYRRIHYAFSGHCTWADARVIINEYVAEAATARGLTLTEFVRVMQIDLAAVASELTSRTGSIITEGQVKKWCRRWLA